MKRTPSRPLRSASLLAVVLSAAFLGCGSSGAGSEEDRSVPAIDGSVASLTGTVIDFATTRPLAGRTVWVGGKSTTTDPRGTFTFTHVELPYDAVVIDADGSTVSIYQGLFRRDPVLPHMNTLEAGANTATVAGDVSGGGEYPLAATDGVGIYFFSDDADNQSLISGALPGGMNGPSYGPMSLNWDGVDSISGRLMALGVFKSSSDGRMSAFFAEQALTLKKGQKAFDDLALTALPKMKHVKGSIVTPFDATIVAKQAYYRLPVAGAEIAISVPQDSTTFFDDELPDLSRLDGTWCVGANAATDAPSGSALTEACGVTPGQTDVSLVLQNPPSFSSLKEESRLEKDTRFAWSAFEGGIHLLELVSAVPSKKFPSVYVYTAATSLTWPDLPYAGVSFPGTASYDVTVAGFGPYRTMDDAFGIDGLAAPAPAVRQRSDSVTLYLTTGP